MTLLEEVARAICREDGYRNPDEDWTRETNGYPNKVASERPIPEGGRERWRLYLRHARAAARIIGLRVMADGE